MNSKITRFGKFFSATAVFVLMLALLFSLVSCGDKKEASGTLTLVIAGEEEQLFTVDLDKITIDNGLFSVLDSLKCEGLLDYSATSGFLTEIGEVKQDASQGIYVGIWTSVEDDFDVSVLMSTREYNGMTLVSSGVGAADMTLCDGAVIYIGTMSW